MALTNRPSNNDWFLFPDGEIIKINRTGEDYIEIQHADGSFEMVEMAVWQKLGAERVNAPVGRSDNDVADQYEVDFISLGVAPGTEGIKQNEIYSDNE